MKDYSMEEGGRGRRGCSRLEVEVLLVLLLLLALGAAIIILLVFKLPKNPHIISQESLPPETCTSPICVQNAAGLLSDMDLTVDPCEDFVQYACGGWLEQTEIPDTMSRFHRRLQNKEKVTGQLKDLIEKDIQQNEPGAVQKVKKWYQSCIDEAGIEKAGYAPLQQMVDEIGGWPMATKGWVPSSTTLEQRLAGAFHRGTMLLAELNPGPSKEDPAVTRLQIQQHKPALGSRDVYLGDRNASRLTAYQDFAAEVAVLLGGDPSTAQQQAVQMLDLEVELAQAMYPQALFYQEDKLPSTLFTIDQLNTNVTQDFDWLAFLNNLYTPLAIELKKENFVELKGPAYFQKAITLFKSTPSSTMQNFIAWNTLRPLLEYLPIDAVAASLNKYNKVALGTDSVTNKPRWDQCIHQVKFDGEFHGRDYGLAVSRLWLPVYFDNQAKQKVEEMVGNLRVSIAGMLDESWLSEETKVKAKRKADAVNFMLGYPDWLYENQTLDSYYSVFNVEEGQYFNNLVGMRGGGLLAKLRKLEEPSLPASWPAEFPPVDVDAGYSPRLNFMVFPAALMQAPIFDKNYSDAMNYGALGMIIGHEFTHAFDTIGRMYNPDGVLTDWWTKADEKTFSTLADCIRSQYSSYSIPEAGPQAKVDGDLTLAENIADNGGLKAAFRAYLISKNKLDEVSQKLPGLDLTDDQLFFASNGRILCEHIRVEAYQEILAYDPHSPELIRLKGITDNSKEFSSAFSCKPGSESNPEKKCAVW